MEILIDQTLALWANLFAGVMVRDSMMDNFIIIGAILAGMLVVGWLFAETFGVNENEEWNF